MASTGVALILALLFASAGIPATGQEVDDRIEEEIFRSYDKEVSALFVGEQAMRFLRKVDKVAYIRFASVYRDFTDAGDLLDEVSQAIAESDVTDQQNLF